MFRVGQIDLGRKRPSGRDKRVVWDLMIRGLMMGNSWRGVLEAVLDMIPDCQLLLYNTTIYSPVQSVDQRHPTL
jgi:hypothetical protein